MADLFKLVGRIVINNTEANESIDDTTKRAEGLSETLAGTGKQAETTSKDLEKKTGWNSAAVFFGNMATKVATLAGDAIKYTGKTGFAYNSMMEQYQTAFGVLIGSEEKAVQLLDDLWTLAADTPMEIEGLAKNAQDLITYGIAVEDVIPMLNMLGDASLGSQKKMDGIVYAFGQIKAYEQLRGQETMQMIENGFPILEMLEKTMEMSVGEILEAREKGNISFEDVLDAFMYATSEEGRFFGSMEKYATTYEGQKAKLSDNFAQTVGNLTLAFFELSKTDIIPKINESLEEFGKWVSENQNTLGKLAEAMGNFATASFDAALDFFKWMVDNGEVVTAVLAGIGAALAVGAIAAHPYAAAIMAVVAGLVLLNEQAKKGQEEYLSNLNEEMSAPHRLAGKYAGWTEDQKTAAQNYITDYLGGFDTSDAVLELRNVGLSEEAITDFRTDMSEALNDSDFTVEISDTWFEEGTEANLQNQIDNMTFDAAVHLYTDNSNLDTLYSIATGNGIDGSHASGLDRVPRDGYIARLHKDEAVLNSTMAAAYRNGTMGGGTGRLEAMLSQVLAALQQMAANMGGQQIVLDSGVLVGQLAPAMDVRLGTLTSRKGRRN